MDQCLQVPEILRLICNEVERRSTAVAIALTCRNFLEPGLDRVWRKVNSLSAIAGCLPPDLLNVKKLSGSRLHHFNLTRGLLPEDLRRYRSFYAHRIRKMDILSQSSTFSAEAWQALQLATEWQPGALSPLVTSLSFRNVSSNIHSYHSLSFPYLSLFLGPNLVCLEFGIRSDVPIQVTSAQAIATRTASALKQLTIWDTSVTGPPFIAKYLPSFSWPNLETLCLPDISVDAFAPLMSLPRLVSLEIKGLQSIPSLYTPTENGMVPEDILELPGCAEDMFPCLRFLTFGGAFKGACRFAGVVGFIQRLPSGNRVSTIRCSLYNSLSASECLKLVHTILRHCTAQNIESLSLRGAVDEDYREGLELDTKTPFKCVVPLFVCQRLKHLEVGLTQGWCLEEEELGKVAAAWPGIETLMLGAEFASTHLPRIDHSHILELLRRCPELSSLGLRFDATRVGTLEEGDATVMCRSLESPLRTLSVCDSPIYSPSRVVAFLGYHCPLLKTVNYFENVSEGDDALLNAYPDRWEVATSFFASSWS